MLKVKNRITLEGESVVDGLAIARYRAEIDSDNPNNMIITASQMDKIGYKTNREEARKDQAEFEDIAYVKQDEMLEELSEEEE